jgi:hypothetical protein
MHWLYRFLFYTVTGSISLFPMMSCKETLEFYLRLFCRFLTWHVFYFNLTVFLYFCLSDKLVISTSSHQIRNWLVAVSYLLVFVRITPCSGDYSRGERNTDVKTRKTLKQLMTTGISLLVDPWRMSGKHHQLWVTTNEFSGKSVNILFDFFHKLSFVHTHWNNQSVALLNMLFFLFILSFAYDNKIVDGTCSCLFF